MGKTGDGQHNGALNAALGRQEVASVPAGRAAMGSGANNTARYVGSAISLAIVTVIVTPGGASRGAAGLLFSWNTAATLTSAFTLLGLAVVLVSRPGAGTHRHPATASATPSIDARTRSNDV